MKKLNTNKLILNLTAINQNLINGRNGKEENILADAVEFHISNAKNNVLSLEYHYNNNNKESYEKVSYNLMKNLELIDEYLNETFEKSELIREFKENIIRSFTAIITELGIF